MFIAGGIQPLNGFRVITPGSVCREKNCGKSGNNNRCANESAVANARAGKLAYKALSLTRI
jgi:hypothetical protein